MTTLVAPGQVYARLTVEAFSHHDKNRNALWLCRCVCGSLTRVQGGTLRMGRIRSCGCLKDEASRARMLKHGHAVHGQRTREYTSWLAMLQRCLNTACPGYADYGAKGITVHGPWQTDFLEFLAYVGPRPKGTSLDRYPNPRGNYEPGNVRWATPQQQTLNRAVTVRLTFNGETLTIDEWAARLGIVRGTLVTRLHRGWSAERALTQATQEKKR